MVQTVRADETLHSRAPCAGAGPAFGICSRAEAAAGWLLTSRTSGPRAALGGQSTLASGWMCLTLPLIQTALGTWVTHK